MRSFVVRAAMFVFGFAVGLPASQAAHGPNIVLILCDDLGYGDVHAFNPDRGKIATPCIDTLATEGMMFTDAHAPSAVCSPTRYSILTGRYNWRSRLQSGVLGGMAEPLIAPDRMTVATFLKDQGYTTACIGKWHLGLDFGPRKFTSPLTNGPLQHGFDHFFGISASLDMPPYAWIEDDRFPESPTVRKGWTRVGPATPSFKADDVLPRLTKKAVEYIRTHSNSRDQPYFLYLSFTAPHTPIVPLPEWKGKSGLGDYADFVMQTDAAVGEVLKAIDESGQRENTIVCFASDNGCAPAARPKELEATGHYPSAEFRGYKSDIWEGGHRIPLIVRWPGVISPGSKSAQLVGLVDLFATTVDIVQGEHPESAAEDSFSMLRILKGQDAPIRAYDIYHSINGCFSVREGDWKLELCSGSGGWGSPRENQAAAKHLPKVQLYDIANDPEEKNNLEAEHPAVVTRLTQILQKAIDDGRTTPGRPLKNDVAIEMYK